MRRMLYLLEKFLAWLWIARWPSLMPGWFEEIWAGVFLVLINAARRARFGVRCNECECCGMVYPQDDLHPVLKSDGNIYPECTGCGQFGEMIRAIHARRPKAA